VPPLKRQIKAALPNFFPRAVRNISSIWRIITAIGVQEGSIGFKRVHG
jgi:hypothetical protein